MRRHNFELIAKDLRARLSGRVDEQVLMRRHTSFKIGGICEVMVYPKDVKELELVIRYCEERDIPWRVIGLGTNILVRDEGIKEVVVNLRESFQELELIDETKVKAGAGVKLAKVVKFAGLNSLSGLEFAAGIPGTVGGAIVMNAGAEGKAIQDVVQRVEFYRYPEGSWYESIKDLKFFYRGLERKPKSVVLSAEFKLKEGKEREIRKRILEGLKHRRKTQPLRYPCAGSIFKNPEGNFAGRLIEKVGLKGTRIGDAQISEKHANFIVNRGRAKAKDVLALIDLARGRVKEESGIELELEIEVIGEKDDRGI